MKKRLAYIDIARALAIIFIALAHTLGYSKHAFFLYKFLYSFHVALFFILSGLTFRIKKDETFGHFLKRKFMRIMVPYLVFSLLFLIPYLLLGNAISDTLNVNTSFSLITQLKNILYGVGYANALKQNSALWFLPALFMMEVVYYGVLKYTKKKYLLYNLPIVIAIGYLGKFIPIVLPWGINSVIVLGFYFYLGFIMQEYHVLENKKWASYPLLIASLLIGIIACYLNPVRIAYMNYQYGPLTLAYLSGVTLSYATIIFAQKIKNFKWLTYIGQSTMGILIFHKIVIVICQAKIPIIRHFLTNSNVFCEIMMSFVVTILSIVVSLIGTIIVRKICPWALGERKKEVLYENC